MRHLLVNRPSQPFGVKKMNGEHWLTGYELKKLIDQLRLFNRVKNHGTSWMTLSFLPSGAYIEGPFHMSDACMKMLQVPFDTLIMRVPAGSFKVLPEDVDSYEDLSMKIFSDSGEVTEIILFGRDGYTISSLREDEELGWSWRDER